MSPTFRMSRVFRTIVIVISVLLVAFFALESTVTTSIPKPFKVQNIRERPSRTEIPRIGSRPTQHHQSNRVHLDGVFMPKRKKAPPKEGKYMKNYYNTTALDNRGKRIYDYAKLKLEILKRKRIEMSNIQKGSNPVEQRQYDDRAAERIKDPEELARKTKRIKTPERLPTEDYYAVNKAGESRVLAEQNKAIGIPKASVRSRYLAERRSKDTSQQPIFVVILARMRTGSTLLGEIFNQNPSIFYMYEPLNAIDPSLRAGTVAVSEHKNISANLLLEYSHCRFPKNFAQTWLQWNGGPAHSSKLLLLCPETGSRGWRNCSTLTLNNLRDVCQTSNERFCVKLIRSELDYLKPLVDEGINVKVIHLVRDPRGVANSRRLYYMLHRPRLPERNRNDSQTRFKGRLDVLGLVGNYPDHVVHTIPRLCQWTRDSILEVKKKPAWLRNRYKLVRYEDFALDPLRVTRDIYNFLDLELPQRVVEWIVENTRNNDVASVKLFSTHKNSSQTAMRWRVSLNPMQVRQVEALCKEAMDLLGYKKVMIPSQLTDFEVPLMGPLPMDDTL